MEAQIGAKVDATCDLTGVIVSYRRLWPVVAEGAAVFWSAEAAAGSRSISQSAALPSAVMQGSNDRLSVRATPGRVAVQKATASMVRWLTR